MVLFKQLAPGPDMWACVSNAHPRNPSPSPSPPLPLTVSPYSQNLTAEMKTGKELIHVRIWLEKFTFQKGLRELLSVYMSHLKWRSASSFSLLPLSVSPTAAQGLAITDTGRLAQVMTCRRLWAAVWEGGGEGAACCILQSLPARAGFAGGMRKNFAQPRRQPPSPDLRRANEKKPQVSYIHIRDMKLLGWRLIGR